jgi:hypothetical protein
MKSERQAEFWALPWLMARVDDDFARFFRARGVEVDWDFDKKTGQHWYELFDETGLVCQVDFGTPPEEFLADIPYFARGNAGIGPTDYMCAFPPDRTARILAIYERCHGHDALSQK